MATAPHETAIASLWLLPCPADEAMLQSIVMQLAERHGTPPFHPHLTVAGDIPRTPSSLRPAMAAIAAAAKKFSAPVTGIKTGDLFFRSFYAAFAVTPELGALRQAAERALDQSFGEFMPHISLLYGPVEPAAKQQSASAWHAALAGRPITFDRLAMTNSANDVPIADWRILFTENLA